jgi:hypothetical protein
MIHDQLSFNLLCQPEPWQFSLPRQCLPVELYYTVMLPVYLFPGDLILDRASGLCGKLGRMWPAAKVTDDGYDNDRDTMLNGDCWNLEAHTSCQSQDFSPSADDLRLSKTSRSIHEYIITFDNLDANLQLSISKIIESPIYHQLLLPYLSSRHTILECLS